MADNQPNDSHGLPQGSRCRRMVGRRKVMVGVALLMGVVLGCAIAIFGMLQRLETRTAGFQPPMTAAERQRLLPADPVLHSAPSLDGLRYGDQSKTQDASSSLGSMQAEKAPLSQALIIQRADLHADAHAGLHSASRVQ
jgi:hypothetical protein